jgi:integrase
VSGELVGLDWADVRLDARGIAMRQSQPDTDTEAPKSEAGDRVITVDAGTVKVLTAWRTAQLYERVAWGAGWTDSGRVFTREDGSALRPEYVSDRFDRLVCHRSASTTCGTVRRRCCLRPASR